MRNLPIKTFMGAALTFVAAIVLSVGVMDVAEAKRMGGGKSFGGKSSFNQPAQNRQQAAPANSNPSGTQQSAAQTQNAGQRAALAGRGGMMGMLGGLALGGLLGALFFGGAFENINFMDVLIFGLIAFVLYKIFASRKHTAMSQTQSRSQPVTANYAPTDMDDDVVTSRRDGQTPQAQARPSQQHRSSSAFETDLLFKDKLSGAAPGYAGAGAVTEPRGLSNVEAFRPSPGAIPKGFDSVGFVEGATAAYRRLQHAWDNGDLADLRQFTTDKVFGELQDQIRARNGENRTELLKVECELLEVREVGPNTEATVVFDVLMRETDADSINDDGDDARLATSVREIWHFTRPTRSVQPTWFLDGIQQIEA